MSVTSDEYRAAARLFASGVTVVALVHEDGLHGMTASSFASVSLEPPLVLVCLDKSSRTRELLVETGRFAVNVLGEGQEDVAVAFARSGDKPFEEIGHRIDHPGAPFLEGAIAMLACTTDNVVAGGDHDIFIGEVTATEIRPGPPLVYFDQAYRHLPEPR